MVMLNLAAGKSQGENKKSVPEGTLVVNKVLTASIKWPEKSGLKLMTNPKKSMDDPLAPSGRGLG